MIHETFHVFQRQRHPAWAANEAELFLYPVDDAGLLAAGRQETEAFQRALAAKRPRRRLLEPPGSLPAAHDSGRCPLAPWVTSGDELDEGRAGLRRNLSWGSCSGPEIPARGRVWSRGRPLSAPLDRLRQGGAARPLRSGLAKEPGRRAGRQPRREAGQERRHRQSPHPACGFKPAASTAWRPVPGGVAKLAGERRSLRGPPGPSGLEDRDRVRAPLFPQDSVR